jgi:hypothetical protein
LPAYQSASANLTASFDVWHKRLGHPSHGVLRQLLHNRAVNNLHIMGHVNENDDCVTCIQAKQSRLPFLVSDSVATERLGLVHADVIGKLPCISIGGSRWVLSMMDDFSRYSEVVCLRTKAEVAGAFWVCISRRTEIRGEYPLC